MKSGKLKRFNPRALSAALASLVVLGGVGLGIDANAADASGTATATVVTPISISGGTAANALNFGSFSTAASGGVTISSTGAARTTTGPVLISTAVGSRATFTVAGQANLGYSITLPSSALTITRASGSETMTVTAFRGSTTSVTTASASNSFTSTLPASGPESLYVGATVTAAAAQAPGVYSGNYTVTVEYN